ncbi:MAG: HlyD family type I secretion periplasmic adaptor subunit [Clostridiaceae bacterium]|nr:HlyD family type I secretion periplasmic adaptor subunit [Clostridiaceae bacterium]
MRGPRSPSSQSQRTKQMVIRSFQSEAAEIEDAPLPAHVRKTLHVAAAMMVILLVVACVFRMDRVVTSSFGQIVTAEPTIVIQPIDSSIIKRIAVREGERVSRGQILGELDPTFAVADVATLTDQLDSLDAEIARCEAEEANRPLAFHQSEGGGAQRYQALQTALYAQRQAELAAQTHAYDEQISQATASIHLIRNNIVRYGDRSKFTQELETIRSELAEQQLETRVNLLQTSDQKVELLRTLEEARNNLDVTEHQMEATRAARHALIRQCYAQTTQELVTARNNRAGAMEQLEKAKRHQDLVTLVAPEDAVVLRVAKLSIGSVLQPGEVFIELASLHSPVEAEITIDPREVGFLRPGDAVVLKLDPYNYAEHGYAEGTLGWISEGTFVSPDSGTGGSSNPAGTTSQSDAGVAARDAELRSATPFYKARVQITRTDFKNVPDDFRLLPGMTLSADIKVGTRSMIWYLASGFVRGLSESMREP